MTSQPNLNPCSDPSPFQSDRVIDPVPPYCPVDERHEGSLKDVAAVDYSWLLDELSNNKTGYGQNALCDPMQKGHIINEQGMSHPDRNTIYRQANSLRGADEAMKDLFSDIIVLDEQGKAHQVPIFWGSQERAVAWALQQNIRKDESNVVDRLKLPLLALYSTSFEPNNSRYLYHRAVDYLRDHKRDFKPGFTRQEWKHERDTIFGVARGIPIDVGYTLYVWALHEDDMKTMLVQIWSKFSPIAYIRVRGISWEIGVKLKAANNNVTVDVGEKTDRVLKYEISMVAETFIHQPIVRKKAVLTTKMEFVDSLNESEVQEVLDRLEESIESFEQ